MKVLLVNDYATPTAGAELMTLTLRDSLRTRGHDARLFSSSARPLSAQIESDYAAVGTTSRLRTYLQMANPVAAIRLRQVVGAFQPDIVHVRMFLTQLSPLILPVLNEVPALLHVTDYRPICPTSQKLLPDGSFCYDRQGLVCLQAGCLPLHHWIPLTVQTNLWQRWRNTFNLVVANSEWVRRRLIADGVETQAAIWNGVPIEPARPPLKSPPTIAFAGRLVPSKGVDVLLRASATVAAELPDLRILIAGEGPERDGLQMLANDLGLEQNAVFGGHVPRATLNRSFQEAWVQAVPSLWEEPFGLVAAESMMRGTAVVVSNLGGLSEIVEDGRTGVRVPPGDPDALAGSLLDILRDRSNAELMGGAARSFALEHLSAGRAVNDFIRLYEQVLRGDAGASSATVR